MDTDVSELLDTVYRAPLVQCIVHIGYGVLGYSGMVFCTSWVQRIELLRYEVLAKSVIFLIFDQSIRYYVYTDVDTVYSSKSGNGLEFFKVLDTSYRSRIIRRISCQISRLSGTLHIYSKMHDDKPMWAVDRVVTPTPGSAITIPETANEFAIKDTENEAVRLMMFPLSLIGEAKTWLDELNEGTIETNSHGHNLSKGNIIKIFHHGLNEITQEVLNVAAGGIFLYKTPNQANQLLEDKVLLKLDWAKNPKTKSSLKKTVAFAAEGSSNSNSNKIMA
nr:hypothetical protein [Tanacetum cinerariifolium]